LLGAAKRFEFEPKAGEVLIVDKGASLRIVLAILPKLPQMFFFLETCRKAMEELHGFKSESVYIDLRACGEHAFSLADAVVSSHTALLFEAKHYGKKAKEKKFFPRLTFFPPEGQKWQGSELVPAIEKACATNLVRYLAGLAGNDLTPSEYVKRATQSGKAHGLKSQFYSLEKLKKLQAGAFLAVSQACEDRGGGILKLTYRPARPKAKVAFVGKGITFDTGGVQLKQGEHMYGMNGDMGGSALALALVLLAKQQKWDCEVSAFLAITENAIGPKSFKPNDVVKTLEGKTIEIIDSDAEGRMVLSDTLALAAQDKPDLLMDFATLTGSCIRAIGTGYSGVYSNRSEWFPVLTEAGRVSGERVWPFPNDEDFGRCLKSDIADIKQCRNSGGVDHIEASYFLRQFVPEKVGWVHVDLSAAESEEGLGHVPTKLTGFGVRFTAEFIRRWAELR
jgi:leucyl aminopeptidase